MIDQLMYTGLTKVNLGDWLQNADGSWRVYPNGSLGSQGIPAVPDFPYVQHGDGGGVPTTVTKDYRRTIIAAWDIYVYDEPGSFSRIRSIMERAKDNLEGMTSQISTDGWRLTEVVQTSFSADVYDPVKEQVNKRATFRVVASRAL